MRYRRRTIKASPNLPPALYIAFLPPALYHCWDFSTRSIRGFRKRWSHHHHGFYYNATPEATPKRPMARPPTPKFPATAADPRSTISPARRHDPPRWGRAGPTGTCTPMGAPPEGETRGGTEGPRQPWGASVVISPAGPGRGEPQRTAGGFGLWSVCFPPALVRTARRLPVEALCESGVLVSLTGYPRGGAPGPG